MIYNIMVAAEDVDSELNSFGLCKSKQRERNYTSSYYKTFSVAKFREKIIIKTILKNGNKWSTKDYMEFNPSMEVHTKDLLYSTENSFLCRSHKFFWVISPSILVARSTYFPV